MPNRWIKEAYCASSRINAVSAEARDLWVRLLVNADDHGYFHGGPQLVASACYPLQPNARKCEQLLLALEGARLIARYESGGKQYLAIAQWYERPRSKPRYPQPSQVICEQLQADVCNGEQLQSSTRARLTSTSTSTSTTPNEEPVSFDPLAGWRGVGGERQTRWQAAYPAVDVVGEIKKAGEWLRANPKNRKSNYERFLVNWMSRAQDKAPPKGGGNGKSRGVAI